MKKTQKMLTLLVSLVVCLGVSASAAEGIAVQVESLELTAYEMQEALVSNAKIDAYIAAKRAIKSTRAGGSGSLSVPLYQQTTTNYCGPASMQMVVKYCTGKNDSQSFIAGKIGTTVDGSSTSNIASTLSTYYGLNYQLTTMSASALSNSLEYSIDNNFPVIASVYKMPEYSNKHIIVLTGYTFNSSGYMTSVTYNDPHHNANYFGRHTISFAVLGEAINSNAGKYIRYAG